MKYVNNKTIHRLRMQFLLLLIAILNLAWTSGGDLKIFHQMSGAPKGVDSVQAQSTGALTSRLKLSESYGSIKLDAHAFFNALENSPSGNIVSLSPNVLLAGEAIPLSFTLIDDGEAFAQLRGDRLHLTYELHTIQVRIGRQAISFGQGRIFTPLDRVSPFSPASVDREYKPGVDALKLEGYWGVAGEWTILAAERGKWSLDDTVFASKMKDSFGGWDLELTLLWVGGDHVYGLGTAGSIGDIGIYSDFSYTQSSTIGIRSGADTNLKQLDHFTRSTIGVDWSWVTGGGGRVGIESAWFGDGATHPNNYILSAQDPRFLTGERWLLGRAYTALTIQQQLSAIVHISILMIHNIEDQSTLLSPSLQWSVSDEVNASLGSFIGVGKGLNAQVIRSEFGSLTWASFAMIAAYY